VKAIREEISPEIAAAVVKKGLGRYSAVCLNPKKTRKLIKEAISTDFRGGMRTHRSPSITW